MTQTQPTTCSHNYQSAELLPSTPTPCRGCGALLVATNRVVANGRHPSHNASPNRVVASEKGVNAAYPGARDAATLTVIENL